MKDCPRKQWPLPLVAAALALLSGAPLSHGSLCSTQIVSQPQFIELAGTSLPVPLGISPVSYRLYVKGLFSLSPPIRVAIFLGSRTHFSYGYPPEEDSDLDVILLSDSDSTQWMGVHSLAEGLDLKVHVVSTTETNAGVFFQKPITQFPQTQAEEKIIFAKAASLPWYLGGFARSAPSARSRYRDLIFERSPFISENERRWVRENRFNLFMPPPSTFSVNKEAIFLFRQDAPLPEQAESELDGLTALLQARDFKHLYRIQTSELD